MWSLRQALTELTQLVTDLSGESPGEIAQFQSVFPQGHLPDGFDPAQGLRQLFPPGQTVSLASLKNYVFSRNGEVDTTGIQPFVQVRADGTGNWLLRTDFVFDFPGIYEPVVNPRFGIGFVFAFSDDGAGHGYVAADNGDGNDSNWCIVTGFDPWIAKNWITIFAESAALYTSDAQGFDKLPPISTAATDNGFTGLSFLGGPKPGDPTPEVQLGHGISSPINALWGI